MANYKVEITGINTNDLKTLTHEENIAKEQALQNEEEYIPNESNMAIKADIENELNSLKEEAKTLIMLFASLKVITM